MPLLILGIGVTEPPIARRAVHSSRGMAWLIMRALSVYFIYRVRRGPLRGGSAGLDYRVGRRTIPGANVGAGSGVNGSSLSSSSSLGSAALASGDLASGALESVALLDSCAGGGVAGVCACAQVAFANSDLAFQGNHLFQGNFYGANIYDISNPPNAASTGCPSTLPQGTARRRFVRAQDCGIRR
jgi:hypothetical protein